MPISGIISQSGRRYLKVDQSGQSTAVPIELLFDEPRRVNLALRNAGIVDVSGQQMRNLQEMAASISVWHDALVVERPGWVGENLFCLPSGRVMSKSESLAYETAVTQKMCEASQHGSLKGWLKKVAGPLQRQTIPIFCLCMAFLPILRRYAPDLPNCGFQLCGPSGSGKTTLLKLVQSTLGPPCDVSGHPNIADAELVSQQPHQHLYRHAESLMLIDNLELLGLGLCDRPRLRSVNGFVRALLGGTSGHFATARSSFLIAGNEQLRELTGPIFSVSLLKDIPALLVDSPHGIFDSITEGYASGSAFAEALVRAARANHGHAIPYLVERLFSEDGSVVERRIQRRVKQFRALAGVDENDGASVRLANQFGHVYAAGRIAKHYGCLPKAWRVGPAVLRGYQAHQSSACSHAPFNERLAALAQGDDLIEVPKGGLKPKTKEERRRFAAAAGFVSRTGSHVEVLIRSGQVGKLFPGASLKQSTPGVRDHLVHEGKRLTTKRKLLASGKLERVHVFRV